MEEKEIELYNEIHRYLTKEMAPDEVFKFENKLEADAAFRSKFLLHKNIYALRYNKNEKVQSALDLMKQIRSEDTKPESSFERLESQESTSELEPATPENLARESSSQVPSNSRSIISRFRKPLSAAASILLLICIPSIIYFLSPQYDPLDLTSNDPSMSIDPSASIESLDDIKKLATQLEEEFNNYEYEKALKTSISFLQKIDKNNNDDYPEALRAKGTSQFEIGSFEDALITFTEYEEFEKELARSFKEKCYQKIKDKPKSK